MRLRCMIVLLAFLCAVSAFSQTTANDVLGVHNLTPASGSAIYAPSGNLGCTYCHAPHSGVGGNTPLWNQTLSKATYTPYTSSTYKDTGNVQPPVGTSSSLCLSCHDGTVAVGQTAAYGRVRMAGTMLPTDVFGRDLSSSHPFSLVNSPPNDATNLVASLHTNGTTADPLKKVNLINNNVECTTCHDPHVQATDTVAQNFLVRDGSSGQLCLACHDPNRIVEGQANVLAGWSGSIHQSSVTKVDPAANVGPYTTVAQNACNSCHVEHHANGAAGLLRAATPVVTGMDATTQSCVTCHNGGNYLSPAAPNIMAEQAKVGHPLPSGNNIHDPNEPGVLLNNRHATCVDCHNAHGSAQTTAFSAPPALRPSQSGAIGINALDGTSVLTPATNQYENCLRCHGTGPGKQRLAIYGYSPIRLVSAPDDLNLIPQFSANAISSHPVFHNSSSGLPQTSLRAYMLNFSGQDSARPTGPRIFCSDCHNSDDNREFGGVGPNGPHGSTKSHILERNYEFSQATLPGGPVTNVFPNPDPTINGPFAMCAKCHDLSIVLSATSWSGHVNHVGTDGFSCSVCHTSHGIGATSSNITGERLVNFDIKVVGQNGTLPIAYSRSTVPTGSCTLTCHNVVHNADGTVSAAAASATMKAGVRK